MTGRAKHRAVASWVFGLLLLAFLAAIVTFAPTLQLGPIQSRIVGLLSAAFAGVLAYFLTGAIEAWFESPKSNRGTLIVRASGGFGTFFLVLLLWYYLN